MPLKVDLLFLVWLFPGVLQPSTVWRPVCTTLSHVQHVFGSICRVGTYSGGDIDVWRHRFRSQYKAMLSATGVGSSAEETLQGSG